MAVDSKDVELRIRARDYSQKTLSEVVDALKSLVDAQGAQIEAAKRGEVSVRTLEESYRKLENAGKALLSQDSLIRMYEKQVRTLEDVRAKVEAARQAQSDYERSLDGVTERTSRQNAELNKLGKAVAAAERAQVQAEGRVTKAVERLAQYGIEADKVAEAQERIRSSVNLVNQALDKQDAALSTVEADVRAYKRAMAEAKEAAEAAARFEEERQRAMRRVREGEVNLMWQELLAEREAKERAAAEAAKERAAAQKAAEEDAIRAKKEALALAHEQAIAEDKARDRAKVEAEAREAQRAALNKAADEAEALAKGYETLARSVKNVRGDTLSKQIKAISDPTGEALKTTEGLTKALDGLEKKTSEIRGPVEGYGKSLKELETIQKSLVSVASQVDAYQRQMDAVRAARTEFTKARDAVKQLVDQMRSGKGDTAQLTQQMTRAQAALRTAAEAMRRQTQTARDMRSALREAGVDTQNLAKAEAQLVNEATRAVEVTKRLTDAYNQHGEAAERAAVKVKKFGMGERTTLSFFQRLRGEVLALTTAFVGVQAAVDTASQSLEAYRSKQAVESRLAVMVGNDAKLVKEEWDYLMGQARRLGFGFENLAMSYSKFGVAAKQMGMTTDETRYIFERMAEASRVAKMSTDDFEASLKAIEQMISKGAIQAEELRQQLGDRLPGAMAMAAKGADMTVAEFTKMMEQGQIGAEFVINLARQLGDEYGNRLPEAINSMAAQEGRLETAIYNFRLAIAENGFVAAYTEFIAKLTDVLNSQEGRQLAQLLADGFKSVVEILKWCADNVNLLAAAFAGLIGLQVLRWALGVLRTMRDVRTELLSLRGVLTGTALGVTSVGTAVGGMAAAMGVGARGVATLTKGVGLLSLALRGLLRLIPVVGAGLIAWDVYSALSSDKKAAEQAGADVGQAFADGMRTELDESAGGSRDQMAASALDKTLKQLEERTAKEDKRTRMKGAKADLQERLDIASEEYEFLKNQAESQIKDEKLRAETLERIEKAKNEKLRVERMKFEQEQAAAASRGAGARLSLAQQVADELAKIEDDLARRQTEQDPTATFEDRVRTRVAAVAHEYDKLGQRIEKLARTNRAAAAEARKQLDNFIKQRQEIERIKVTQEELTRLDKNINEQLSLRTTLVERANTLHRTGAISAEQAGLDIANAYRQTAEAITESANALRDVTEASKDVLRPEVYQANIAKADTVLAQNDPTMAGLEGQATEQMKMINTLLTQRDQIIAGIQARRQQGLITEFQMAEQIHATNSRFSGLAESVLAEVRALLDAMTTLGYSKEAVDALRGSVDQLSASLSNAQAGVLNLGQTFVDSFVNNAMTAIDSLAQSIANLITKQEESSDAWAAAGVAAANFFAQLLRDIAMAIIQQQILNMLAGFSGSGGFLGSVGNAAVRMGGQVSHAGGVVGRGTGTRTRTVSPFVFAGAQRYHGGGLPGLRASEIPTILEKGEEVLSRDDPRNILNGGSAAGGGGGSQRFVLVDDRARMAEAMAGAEGEQVTLLHLRKNIPTLKQWMK